MDDDSPFGSGSGRGSCALMTRRNTPRPSGIVISRSSAVRRGLLVKDLFLALREELRAMGVLRESIGRARPRHQLLLPSFKRKVPGMTCVRGSSFRQMLDAAKCVISSHPIQSPAKKPIRATACRFVHVCHLFARGTKGRENPLPSITVKRRSCHTLCQSPFHHNVF